MCHLFVILIFIHLLISIQMDGERILIFPISHNAIWIHLNSNFKQIHQRKCHSFMFPKLETICLRMSQLMNRLHL